MSQERLAALIHEQTAAITRLTERLHIHEAIRRLLRVLALKELTLGQAIGVLAEMAEHSDDPEQQGQNPQAIVDLRQMQVGEP